MNTQIHRLLDDAFAGVTMTTDAQDFKEEIRANLLARVAELVATGIGPDEADEQAMRELGDIHGLLAADTPSSGTDGMAREQHASDSLIELVRSHRVRPKPGFVLRAVLWSVLTLAALALATLSATGALPLPLGPTIALVGLAATGAGLLVGDSLTQETTTNHPMPEPRASGYALASWLALFGLGFAGLVALGALPRWCLVFAVLGVVAAIGGFVFLGVTQTNRHKAWVFAARRRFHESFRGRAGDGGTVRHLHRGHLAADGRRRRRARRDRRLVVGSAPLRRRPGGDAARARPDAFRLAVGARGRQ